MTQKGVLMNSFDMKFKRGKKHKGGRKKKR